MSLPPLVAPVPFPLNDADRERYARQIRLPQIGEIGQRRLANARVLVLGAGGIGSPALSYLAGAGVGTIGIVDSDIVDASNLARQIAHTDADLGRSKARSAADRVTTINPSVRVQAIERPFTAENADEIVAGYDLVIDGFDTFSSRYLASDAAQRAHVPHVWGSALGLDGQLAVFWAAAPGGGPTLRSLHADSPDEGDSCASVGVLGPVCGIVGAALAAEAIKLVVGFGDVVLGRVLVFDALDASWSELPLVHDTSGTDTPNPRAASAPAVSTDELLTMLTTPHPPILLDVREATEDRSTVIEGTVWKPHSSLDPDALGIPKDAPLVVYCATGVRSRAVANTLAGAGWSEVSTLRGGALAWTLRRPRA